MKDDCRLWLESYRELRVEADRLWRRHIRLANQATRTTTQLSPVPGGGGGDRGQILAMLADSDREAVAKHAEALECMKDIEDFIERLPTRESRIILRLRYVELLRWPQVKRALERSHVFYEERQIYRLHGIALREARELWNERKGHG